MNQSSSHNFNKSPDPESFFSFFLINITNLMHTKGDSTDNYILKSKRVLGSLTVNNHSLINNSSYEFDFNIEIALQSLHLYTY